MMLNENTTHIDAGCEGHYMKTQGYTILDAIGDNVTEIKHVLVMNRTTNQWQ